MRGKLLISIFAALVVVALVLAAVLPWGGWGENRAAALHDGFVGRQTCAQCHAKQNELYAGSHHDRAMEEPTERTVLGDFATTFSADGVQWRFTRRSDGYFVTTAGRDGEDHEYRVKYTFGVDPLQQYLVELPGGRLQALRVCWDSRPKAAGGQRWFHVYPGESIPHTDVLHWTSRNQTWNFMCAECHSTDLHKNYQPSEDVYRTSFAEIDVSCESCHGAGREHVAWARSGGGTTLPHLGFGVSLARSTAIDWSIDPRTGSAKGAAQRPYDPQSETCARCHARRTRLTDDYRHGHPIMDSHRVELLTEGLYHPDGQILDEVYVYGSFVQSKMYHRGVTCTDCHDPHSARLHAPGNALCARCHDPKKFDGRGHHHHEPGTKGSLCVECHMPTRNYMVIDPRRDHSLRVPRPDLAARLGTPDACTACHADESSRWAAKHVETWFGAERRREFHFGEALFAARSGGFGAAEQLRRLLADDRQPPIARATGLVESIPYLAELGVAGREALAAGLVDADPLVRMGALRAFDALDGSERLDLGAALLRDPVKSVRLAAAHQLAVVPVAKMPAEVRADFESAADEFFAVQLHNADRPYSYINLGLFYCRQRRFEDSEAAYRAALALAPRSIPAVVNLADLYREWGRDEQCEAVLRAALHKSPSSAEIAHALGLLEVRMKRHRDALPLLRRAAELAPANAHLSYVYGFALTSLRQVAEGLRVLTEAQQRHPNDRELLYALATTHQAHGDVESARRYAKRLVGLAPKHPEFQRLWATLKPQ